MAKHTHRSRSTVPGLWDYECTPVASHLNHDGRGNGITRVLVDWTDSAVDVGTRTLTPIADED